MRFGRVLGTNGFDEVRADAPTLVAIQSEPSSARVDANMPRSNVGFDDGRKPARECVCLNLQCFALGKWQPVGESNPSYLVENQVS